MSGSNHDLAALGLARQLEQGTVSATIIEVMAQHARSRRLANALRAVARDVARGKPVVKALHRHNALPKAYIAALGSGGSRSIRGMTLAVRGVRDYHGRVQSVAWRTSGMLLLVVAALAVSAGWAFPAVADTLAMQGQAPSQSWVMLRSVLTFGLLPLVAVVAIGLAVLAGTRPGWVGRLCGKRSREVYRTAGNRALVTLLKAGFSLEDALPLAGSVCGSPRLEAALERAAQRIQGGTEIATTLGDAGLAPAELSDLWGSTFSGKGLSAMAEGFAEVSSTEADQHTQSLDDRLRAFYALCAGLIVAWGAVVLAVGALEVLRCMSSS